MSAVDIARKIAPDVFCLGPSGRTQTVVYFVRSGSSWVLIDAGWANDASRIERAAEALFGAGSQPAAILLTHCHPDHAGAALRLARVWDCGVYMHPDELPIATGDFAAMQACAGPLDRWVVLPLLRAMGRRRREAALGRSSLGAVARTFEPGSGVPGLPGWECIPTPGHTPGHVSYFRPADRVLITGDALVTLKVNSWSGLLLQRPGLSGPPWYTTWSRAATKQSIARLAQLEPTLLAGGHGEPMTGTDTAAVVNAFAHEQVDGHRRRLFGPRSAVL
jgi:glyoxylase-like metal-dependent hydrolase (beta-lactamase superfamily II)